MSRKVQIKHKAVTLECSFLQNSHLYKPWKKPSTLIHGFCFVWGAFPHQDSWPSGISVHKVLFKGCISKLQTEMCFLLGCLRMGSWERTNFQGLFTSSLTCQVPPAGYASISCPGGEEVLSWATQGLQCGSVAFKEQWPAWPSTQLDCQAHHSEFHRAWLNKGLVQRGCSPVQLSHLCGPHTVGVTYPHLGGHLGESAHWWLLVEPSRRSPNQCSCRKLSNRNTQVSEKPSPRKVNSTLPQLWSNTTM